MGALGYVLDVLNPQVEKQLQLAKPTALTVGRALWPRLDELSQLVPDTCLFFLRDIEASSKASTDPITMARSIVIHLRSYTEEVTDRCYGYGYNEDALTVEKELAFIRECHRLGLKTIANNHGWGRSLDTIREYRQVHVETDLDGMHMYKVWDNDNNTWFSDADSILRYRMYRDKFFWFDMSKLWPTEVGYDATGDRLGWRQLRRELTLGMGHYLIAFRNDGLAGADWFALALQGNTWKGYYPTDKMLEQWGKLLPLGKITVEEEPTMLTTMIFLDSPNHGGKRLTTKGVIIHSTRSGRTGPGSWESEFGRTTSYMMQRGTVSSHYVIGFERGDIAQLVHPDNIAWHAGSDNKEWLGVELTQPTPNDPYSQWQYEELAHLLKSLSMMYGGSSLRSIVGHEETVQGMRAGKSDPGRKFDWGRLWAQLGQPPDTANQVGVEEELKKIDEATEQIRQLIRRP